MPTFGELMKEIDSEGLRSIPDEKLLDLLLTSDFNFQVSCINGKPNYNEQDKSLIYRKEILRRLGS